VQQFDAISDGGTYSNPNLSETASIWQQWPFLGDENSIRLLVNAVAYVWVDLVRYFE
jgi:hypothetical protein